MFIQVIQGKVSDPDHLNRQLQRWRTEIKPGATGYLGATGGVTADGRSISLVRFDSETAADANSTRPEQGAWWNETAKAFDGEISFHNCREVDTAFGGGSNNAGFVQVMQGRANNETEMRRRVAALEDRLRERRPDILGMAIGWHGDGGFTQAVYFTSQDAARKGEAATENDDLRHEFMSLIDGEMTFFDLTAPDID
ncbi:MAG: hypothetical protein QOI55_2666 [Actinomycetota bacterium]|nr:hypothetical protein [Actinomycetota bacterium]